MRIDDRTSVPLSWLVASLIFACTGAWATAMTWFQVKEDISELKTDVKLLKHKAGIPETEAAKNESFFQNAYADMKKHEH